MRSRRLPALLLGALALATMVGSAPTIATTAAGSTAAGSTAAGSTTADSTATGSTVTGPIAATAGPWYRVELLVFAQPEAPGTEQWPPLPILEYPTPARFLVDPAQLEQAREAYGTAASIDHWGRLVIALPGAVPGEPLPHGGPATTGPDAEIAAQEPGEPAVRPFATLPRSELEFGDKAAFMARRGGYQILFHEAWWQPLADINNTVPLLLDRSGDGGPWPRLQGSIRLYLSRYLHLETDLWLNTRGSYLPGQWRMPPPPVAPPSRRLVAPVESDGPVGPEPSGDAAAAPRHPIELQPVYPFRHAVTLRQKRRMRSNEVHYLDHPLMGLIIKLTPVDDVSAPPAGGAD